MIPRIFRLLCNLLPLAVWLWIYANAEVIGLCDPWWERLSAPAVMLAICISLIPMAVILAAPVLGPLLLVVAIVYPIVDFWCGQETK